MKSSRIQTVFLLAAVGLAFALLQIPLAREYALQIFALTILIFFLVKKLKKAKFWHVLPENASVEIPLLTLAFLILIGATGNLTSHFFVLTYVLLFLLAITNKANTAIGTTVAIMIFYFAVNPELNTAQMINLMTLPLLLAFFLFAKRQYDESQINKLLLREETNAAVKSSAAVSDLTSFIRNFLKPKLKTIVNHAEEKDSSLEETISQISLLDSETDKLLHQVEEKVEEKSAPDTVGDEETEKEEAPTTQKS